MQEARFPLSSHAFILIEIVHQRSIRTVGVVTSERLHLIPVNHVKIGRSARTSSAASRNCHVQETASICSTNTNIRVPPHNGSQTQTQSHRYCGFQETKAYLTQ